MSAKVIVIGAGGTSREIAETIGLLPNLECLGFLDDNESLHGQFIDGLPVLGGLLQAHDHPEAQFVMGIAGHKRITLRHDLLTKIGLGDERYCSVIHPSAYLSPNAKMGPGCVMLHNSVVNPGATLEAHCCVNQGCCIGHDTYLGRNVVVAPNGSISGYCKVGANAYVGCNASVAPMLNLGAQVVVGIGSVVVQDIAADCTVFGSPARVIAKPKE